MNKYNCIRWLGVVITVLGVVLCFIAYFNIATQIPTVFLKYRTGITAIGIAIGLFGKWKLDREKKKL